MPISAIPMRVGSAYDYAESVLMPYTAKRGDLAQTELVVDGVHRRVYLHSATLSACAYSPQPIHQQD